MHGVEICAPVECQVCGRQVATRPDGSIRNHTGRYSAIRCPGSTHHDPVVRAVNAIANFKIGKP
jgi:ribosomal protein S27E